MRGFHSLLFAIVAPLCYCHGGVSKNLLKTRKYLVLRLQTIKAIVNSCRFEGSSSDEPRRVKVLDLCCLTRFESEGSGRGDVY